MRLIILLAPLLLILAGCSGEGRAKREYVASCVEMGNTRKACSCMVNKVFENYSHAELEASNSSGISEAMAREFARYAFECTRP